MGNPKIFFQPFMGDLNSGEDTTPGDPFGDFFDGDSSKKVAPGENDIFGWLEFRFGNSQSWIR